MKTSLRLKHIESIKNGLRMPRLQISAILAVTALAAFLASVLLLRAGVTSMAIRYAAAVIAGYFVFLALLRLWVWWQSEESTGADLADADLIGTVGDIGLSGIGPDAAKDVGFGGGGDFAGAGAGGGWDDVPKPVPSSAAFASSPATSSPSASASSSGLSGIDVDLDDGVALLVIAVVLVLVLSALIYIVWIAPVLLAELMIDAAVVSTLYKPIKKIERRHWLLTALKKTCIPAIAVVLLLAAAGYVMQSAEPEAVTVGQFLRGVNADPM